MHPGWDHRYHREQHVENTRFPGCTFVKDAFEQVVRQAIHLPCVPDHIFSSTSATICNRQTRVQVKRFCTFAADDTYYQVSFRTIQGSRMLSRPWWHSRLTTEPHQECHTRYTFTLCYRTRSWPHSTVCTAVVSSVFVERWYVLLVISFCRKVVYMCCLCVHNLRDQNLSYSPVSPSAGAYIFTEGSALRKIKVMRSRRVHQLGSVRGRYYSGVSTMCTVVERPSRDSVGIPLLVSHCGYPTSSAIRRPCAVKEYHGTSYCTV